MFPLMHLPAENRDPLRNTYRDFPAMYDLVQQAVLVYFSYLKADRQRPNRSFSQDYRYPSMLPASSSFDAINAQHEHDPTPAGPDSMASSRLKAYGLIFHK